MNRKKKRPKFTEAATEVVVSVGRVATAVTTIGVLIRAWLELNS